MLARDLGIVFDSVCVCVSPCLRCLYSSIGEVSVLRLNLWKLWMVKG